MRIVLLAIAAYLAVAVWLDPAHAQHVIILKNGGQIGVQSYREEGSMIKFRGLGGEIGISKDQVQAIRRTDGEVAGSLDLNAPALPKAAPETVSKPKPPEERTPRVEEQREAEEEREYQQKLSDVTERLKEAQERYTQAVRDTPSPAPSQVFSEGKIKARQDDLVSRFKDARANPSEPAPVKLLEPSPFSSLPPTTIEVQPPSRTASPYDAPPAYTARQQELLELRNQVIQAEKERERLIDEIKEKNFGSVKIE
jgi:hypothetical protein